ncbi:glycosyltransferase [Candidatus Pelagibacter sp.]|nr:glycosyltransferase [Candidatus Pelagibacter sp.]
MIRILSLGYKSSKFGGPYFVAQSFKKMLNKKKFIIKDFFFTNKIVYYYFFRKKKLTSVLNKFNLMHVHNVYSLANIFVLLISLRAGIPYIISTHGNLNTWSINHNKLKKLVFLRFFKYFFKNATAIHILNNDEKIEISKHVDLTKIKTFVFQNHLDVNSYQFIKKKNNIFNVLFFGRLTEKKGIFELLHIIKIFVDNKILNIKFLIIGPQEKKIYKKCTEIINRLKIGHLIEFKEEIDSIFEKNKLFSQSNVFILPSKDEADSISIKEALACGTPIVISKNCKFLTSNETKEFIKELDFDDNIGFFNAIMSFYRNKEETISLSNKIHLYAKKNFSSELVENNLSELFYDFLSYSNNSIYWDNK